MYAIRTPGYSKQDAEMRWALPDRVFFAAGACHILAYAFVERYGTPDTVVRWIKPVSGHTGNHQFVARGGFVFDYHGFSCRGRFLDHYWKHACRIYPGWDATIETLPVDVLISEEKSKTYQGLWLREPKQFLHDALPRARTYLDRFPSPETCIHI